MLKKLISLVGVSLFFSGIFSLNAMNSETLSEFIDEIDSSKSEAQKFFMVELSEITLQLDKNFKLLIESFCCDSSPIHVKIEDQTILVVDLIKKDLAILVLLTHEYFFDWHFGLVQALCEEIERQLTFSSHYSQFQCMTRVITAWHMKNYLFDLFNQQFKDFFKEKIKFVDDDRPLDQIIQEYNDYKMRLSGFDSIDQFFKELDVKISYFKEDMQLLENEIKHVKTNDILGTINGNFQWILFNYVLPIINSGYSSMPKAFIEKQNNKIIKHGIEWQVTYLKQKKSELEVELKATLVKALQRLKQETESFKPLADSWMLPHKKFLNLLIELAAKECKEVKCCDYIKDFNPLKSVKSFMGSCVGLLAKPFQQVNESCKTIEEFLKISDSSIDCMIGSEGMSGYKKLLLGLVLKEPDCLKNMVKNGLHSLVKKSEKRVVTTKNMVGSIADTMQKTRLKCMLSALTQKDRIALLSHLAQENRKVMNLNYNRVKIIADVIKGENRERLRAKYAHSIGNFSQIKEQYVLCKKHQNEMLESYKRDEKRLMIRVIEEKKWERKQALELELSAIRKGMNMPLSNRFIIKTHARYNELMVLQKKN